MAVADGKVFVGLLNGEMIALDEKTGKLIWRRILRRRHRLNMRAGVSASPVYVNGVVYTSLTFDEGRYVGRAVALDANDGHELWTLKTVPGPGEPGHETWTKDPKSIVWKMGGANVWHAAGRSIPDLGLVYYGTGNPSPNRVGNVRPGNNLYSCSVIALDMKTGKLRWYFQATHHDLWEGDIANPLVLYDAQIDGGAAQRRSPRCVPTAPCFCSIAPRASRSGPSKSGPCGRIRCTRRRPRSPSRWAHGSLIERDCSHWHAASNGFIMRCEFFQPPSDDPPNVLSYAPTTRSSPMSYSPQTGYFYMQGIDRLNWQWNSPDPTSWEFGVERLSEPARSQHR